MTYSNMDLFYIAIIILLILSVIFLECIKHWRRKPDYTTRVIEESKNSLFPHSTVVQL